MSVRDTLVGLLQQWARQNGGAPETAEAMADAYRDEVALDLGRDLLRDGLDAFLRRLVGRENAARILVAVQAKTRRDVARFVREAMVPDPAGETEDHLNDVLARLAHEIEQGAL